MCGVEMVHKTPTICVVIDPINLVLENRPTLYSSVFTNAGKYLRDIDATVFDECFRLFS